LEVPDGSHFSDRYSSLNHFAAVLLPIPDSKNLGRNGGGSMIHLRTLTDPELGNFKDFNPNHFCDFASDGTPFNSSHTLHTSDLWLGHIFKGFPDECWQCQLSGQDKVRGAWARLDTALTQLWEWHKESILENNAYWLKQNLLPKTVPTGDLKLTATGECILIAGVSSKTELILC
jgi:hypothetical protein